jgi:hypothetical protein
LEKYSGETQEKNLELGNRMGIREEDTLLQDGNNGIVDGTLVTELEEEARTLSLGFGDTAIAASAASSLERNDENGTSVGEQDFGKWEPPTSRQGMYDPKLEKEACGVGFIVSIEGVPSHKV